ncbi:unnamed protein product [Amoebophrya sp. A120]|nr:unnamed protein product [Amoebophrya sp. A120]|eukprot:GSA120T00019094001.1
MLRRRHTKSKTPGGQYGWHSPMSSLYLTTARSTSSRPQTNRRSITSIMSSTAKACVVVLLTSELTSLLALPAAAQEVSVEKTSDRTTSSPGTTGVSSTSASSAASRYKPNRAAHEDVVRGSGGQDENHAAHDQVVDHRRDAKLTDVEMMSEVREYEEVKQAAEIDEKENQRLAELARQRQRQKQLQDEIAIAEEDEEKERFEHANVHQSDRKLVDYHHPGAAPVPVAVAAEAAEPEDGAKANPTSSALLQLKMTKQIGTLKNTADPNATDRSEQAAMNAVKAPDDDEVTAAATPADAEHQRNEVLHEKNQLKKLSESVQARMKVVNADFSCLTHVCSVTFPESPSTPIKYTLDVDIKCENTADCKVKCCSYMYCYVNVDKDVVVDYMLSGMSEAVSKRTQLMFDACRDERIVKNVDVPQYQSDDGQISSDRFMELQNFVSPHDCYHRTGFFHFPVIGPESKQYLRSLSTEDGVKAVKHSLPRAQPLTRENDLKNLEDSDVFTDIKEKANPQPDDASNFDFALRGSYTISSTTYAWEDPLLKIDSHGLVGDINNEDENSGKTQGVNTEEHMTGKILRLIVSDSRGHNYPRLDAAYSERLSDWRIPYSREANVVLGDSQKLGIPLKQCCSFVIQAYTGANFFNQYQEITERFVSRNCVVFAANMHEHLYGEQNIEGSTNNSESTR